MRVEQTLRHPFLAVTLLFLTATMYGVPGYAASAGGTSGQDLRRAVAYSVTNLQGALTAYQQRLVELQHEIMERQKVQAATDAIIEHVSDAESTDKALGDARARLDQRLTELSTRCDNLVRSIPGRELGVSNQDQAPDDALAAICKKAGADVSAVIQENNIEKRTKHVQTLLGVRKWVAGRKYSGSVTGN